MSSVNQLYKYSVDLEELHYCFMQEPLMFSSEPEAENLKRAVALKQAVGKISEMATQLLEMQQTVASHWILAPGRAAGDLTKLQERIISVIYAFKKYNLAKEGNDLIHSDPQQRLGHIQTMLKDRFTHLAISMSGTTIDR